MKAFLHSQRGLRLQRSVGLYRGNTIDVARGQTHNCSLSTLGKIRGVQSWGRLSSLSEPVRSINRKYLTGGFRRYGGSSYFLSAAEREESAILSDAPSDDDSGGGAPAAESITENREEANENVKALCEQILTLDAIEMNQLLFRLQKRLGISDAQIQGGGVAVAGGAGGGAGGADEAAPAAAAEEKTHFDVKLASFDAKAKLKIIKEVRAATGLPLKEAKELVEKAPAVVKEGLSKEEAEALSKTLTELGGTIELV